MKLPDGADVHFMYQCPSCTSEMWITKEQAMLNGFKLVCVCGVLIHTDAINHIDVSLDFSRKERKTQWSKVVKESINLLVSQGFTTQEAISHIKSVKDFDKYTDVHNLVKDSLVLIPPD
jgi:hypothetical protein